MFGSFFIICILSYRKSRTNPRSYVILHTLSNPNNFSVFILQTLCQLICKPIQSWVFLSGVSTTASFATIRTSAETRSGTTSAALRRAVICAQGAILIGLPCLLLSIIQHNGPLLILLSIMIPSLMTSMAATSFLFEHVYFNVLLPQNTGYTF